MPAPETSAPETSAPEAGSPETGSPLAADEDGFLEDPGFRIRIRLPLDLERWLPWTGAAVIAVAAFETLTQLVSGSLAGWNGTTPTGTPFPRPDGYHSLLLLAGVVVLALRRGKPDDRRWMPWLRGICCAAAATGGALLTTQLGGSVETVLQPPGSALEASTVTWARDVAAIGSAADAILAAAAAGLAALIYGWARRPERPAGGGSAARLATSGAGAALVAALLGMAAGGASLLWYQVGTEQAHQAISVPAGGPVRDLPSPTPGVFVTLPADCSTPSPGTIVCPGETIITHASAPSPQPIDCQSSPRVGLVQCVAHARPHTPTGCKVMTEGAVYCPPRASPTP